MSIQLAGVDAFGAAEAGKKPLAARMMAIVMGIGRKIFDEVGYTLREDLRHGRISRDPKDWVS